MRQGGQSSPATVETMGGIHCDPALSEKANKAVGGKRFRGLAGHAVTGGCPFFAHAAENVTLC